MYLFLIKLFYNFLRKTNDSEESEDEKPKVKSKQRKSIDSDVKEVTKNLKNVSVSNKSQKKKVVSSDGEIIICFYSRLYSKSFLF